ncbi:hypothetical protein TCSYLVIO_005282 [Trypanosoma cruzi]|nr:hypothetical protein TCSYLVIO_005282 [Trypanosoma cruzi]
MDGAQRIQRERADNMRRGQQAQPHSSHTTKRHPRKEGTQRQQPPTMQKEQTSTTISQLISTANGKWPPHNAHGASTQHTSHTRCITPAGKETRAAHSLPLTPHGHGRRQQPPHATASMHCKRTIQIHCNVHLVCVPAETQSKEAEKRWQSMWRDAQNVQQRCVAEATRRRPPKLMSALQPKQRQFTQDLSKTKKAFPFNLHKPHHTK